jgi:hypothetical protein
MLRCSKHTKILEWCSRREASAAQPAHCGRRIGACAIPTLFVLECGYAVGEFGVNVVDVLTGFEDA